MGKTKIQWAEHTWNPLRDARGGTHCTKVSPGCKNCYASTQTKRFHGREYTYLDDPKAVFVLDEKILAQPLRRKIPTTYFVCSMCDLFHERVPREMIRMILATMRWSNWHIFQVLTKRPERLWAATPPNVWLGTSTENQEMADKRIPELIKCSTPVRFLSAEPLLAPLDLRKYLPSLQWVIVGGESGNQARPCDPDWIRSIVVQCQSAGVKVFVKQLGRNPVGLKLKDAKGGDMQEWPEDLQLRQMPLRERSEEIG